MVMKKGFLSDDPIVTMARYDLCDASAVSPDGDEFFRQPEDLEELRLSSDGGVEPDATIMPAELSLDSSVEDGTFFGDMRTLQESNEVDGGKHGKQQLSEPLGALARTSIVSLSDPSPASEWTEGHVHATPSSRNTSQRLPSSPHSMPNGQALNPSPNGNHSRAASSITEKPANSGRGLKKGFFGTAPARNSSLASVPTTEIPHARASTGAHHTHTHAPHEFRPAPIRSADLAPGQRDQSVGGRIQLIGGEDVLLPATTERQSSELTASMLARMRDRQRAFEALNPLCLAVAAASASAASAGAGTGAGAAGPTDRALQGGSPSSTQKLTEHIERLRAKVESNDVTDTGLQECMQ